MRAHKWKAHARALNLVYAAVTGVLALSTALVMPMAGLDVSTASFWWIALGSVAVSGSVVLRAGLWTAAGAYAAVFWCFHFGLIAVLEAGLVEPASLSAWDQAWVLGPFAAEAAVLALVGTLAFASGASLVSARQRPARRQASPVRAEVAHPHGTAGSMLVCAMAIIWCVIVADTGGIAGFFSSYEEYLQATSDYASALAIVWLGLGCGIVMSVTGKAGWLRTSAIGVFCCVALLALPIGLRGEILFPSIAAVVAYARCGRALSVAKACAFVAALLVLIPAVREIRNTGLQGLPDMVLELRVFDAFVEMGGSLHPVEKVVRWQAEGEPFERGRSYWAPIERAAARILPGVRTPAAEDDMRIMNVLVTDRIGAIGFSPVAEAYRNFGALGVLIVLGVVGATLSAIDTIADRKTAVLAMATLYVPLLTNVRNSFISVPMQCLAGVLLIVVLGLVRHVAASVLCRPYARASYIRSEI